MADVSFEHPAEIGANWDEATLKELGLANGEHSGVAVKVSEAQSQCFADPEPCAVQQQQEGADGIGRQKPDETVTRIGSVYELPYLVVAVDVGLELLGRLW